MNMWNTKNDANNCLLRKIDTGDVTTIYKIFSHPEVVRYRDHVAWIDLPEAICIRF